MVAPIDKLHESPNPQTRCSNCQTVFEVPQDLLDSNDTRVRCGECLCIFDALAGLQREVAAPPAALDPTEVTFDAMSAQYIAAETANQDYSSLDVTYSDFDLFSEDADLPDVPYLDKTQGPANLNFDAVESDHDSTFSETMFNHDVTINADMSLDALGPPPVQPQQPRVPSRLVSPAQAVQAGIQRSVVSADDDVTDVDSAHYAKVEFGKLVQLPAEPIVFDYKDADAAVDEVEARMPSGYVIASGNARPQEISDTTSRVRYRSSSQRWLQYALMALALFVLLGGLYAYRERDNLYNSATARPIITMLCRVAGCQLPAQFDASKLRTIRRSMYSHPDIPDALVVNVVFVNDADFEQRYPVLVVTLEDSTGTQVASGEFYPSEYLAEDMWIKNPVMQTAMAFDISLEINDPGSKASSFKLRYR